MDRNNYLIAFIILNYETYWETFQCIESIRKTFTCEKYSMHYEIVIVDNGSKNDSFHQIYARYREDNDIHVINTGENLGFARGNNVGYRYAKENLSPDFILMINSDIIMVDSAFAEKLIENYNNYNFAVSGPSITNPKGNMLNPFVNFVCNITTVRKAIKELQRKLLLTELGIEPFVAAITRLINWNQNKKSSINRPASCIKLSDEYALHGCFLIFSRAYIDRFDGLYDKTFLYEEEALLRLRCQRAGLDMWYFPNMHVLHNESRSEKYIGGSVNQRHKRRYKNMLYSKEVMLDYLQSEDVL